MSDREQPQKPRRRRRLPGHVGRGLLRAAAAVVVALAVAVGALAVSGRTLPLPGWVVARVEARFDAALGAADLSITGAGLGIGPEGAPRVALDGLRLRDGAGRVIAAAPRLGAIFSPGALLEGRPALRRLRLTGAELTLRRGAGGDFDLALGQGAAPLAKAGSLSGVLDRVEAVLARPALAAVAAVEIEGLGLSYSDARAGRHWQVADGLLTLTQSDDRLAGRVFFSLSGAAETPAEVAVRLESSKTSGEALLAANFSDVRAGDIAVQSPALAFLSVLKAPISGALRTGLDAAGELAPLNAALEIGAGSLDPAAGVAPIRFNAGKAYFSYDPAARRLSLDTVSVDTAAAKISAGGTAYLAGEDAAGRPTALVAQLQLGRVVLAPEKMLAEPAVFEGGALEMKLTLDPFAARIGQAVLTDPGRAYRAEGDIRAAPDGWNLALDFSLDEITPARLLALWPQGLVARTRRWVAENVRAGEVVDVEAALRLAPGGAPRLALDYGFRDAEVRFMRTMPPVTGGSGYATIEGNANTVVVEEGTVTAPTGGEVDVAGTVVRVPDIRLRPAPAEITLSATAPIPAVLSLLDRPPLRVLSKAGQPVDLARGQAEVTAVIDTVLKKGVPPGEIGYDVEATLTGVRSGKLLKGRSLTAESLQLTAAPGKLEIAGKAALDGLPVQGSWRRGPGPDGAGRTRLAGTVELSPRAARAIGLSLPEGSLSGRGKADITVTTGPDAAPAFRLSSALSGVRLALPGLGWAKPEGREGALELAGTLATADRPPRVDRLSLTAPGLSASGHIDLRKGGGLDRAVLDRVALGGWLDAPVTLTGRGQGQPPGIAVTGGTVDLRRADLGGGGGGGGGPIDVALDRLTVSDGIALTGVTGTLAPGGGLSGRLSGRVNGVAPVTVSLVAERNGPGVRVDAGNAGAVLRAAGIFRRASRGELTLLLSPRAADGVYDGQARISGLRVSDAPPLAELLSAISVVGLLEQLDGNGLLFSDVAARFVLSPGRVTVQQASATGPSLGLSLRGSFDLAANRIAMQGVLSPFYLLNGIGAALTRPGEGLFGFNFSLTGKGSDPEVGVNPLSILTPGAFRDLFRRAPPGVGN